jgi:AcrR family transcriptional regulator
MPKCPERGSAVPEVTKPDRRVERTRQALLDALRDLLFERGYDGFAVRDIVERANVGRSTFYEHFEGKDEILREILAGPIEALAASTCEPGGLERLQTILTHFAENAQLIATMLAGSSRRVLSRLLSEHIAAYLAAQLRDERRSFAIPVRLVADHLADAQFGMIESWFANEMPCDAATLARALRDSTAASIAAL